MAHSAGSRLSLCLCILSAFVLFPFFVDDISAPSFRCIILSPHHFVFCVLLFFSECHLSPYRVS